MCEGAHWLTLVGWITLVKFSLCATLIFQFSTFLPPKFILKEISKVIEIFLWEGSKYSIKKIHLLNWKTIRVLNTMED